MTYDHFTSWQSGGATISVGRNCEAGESEADCLAKFNRAVQILKVLYPEDP